MQRMGVLDTQAGARTLGEWYEVIVQGSNIIDKPPIGIELVGIGKDVRVEVDEGLAHPHNRLEGKWFRYFPAPYHARPRTTYVLWDQHTADMSGLLYDARCRVNDAMGLSERFLDDRRLERSL
jgi:hypothetical protein